MSPKDGGRQKLFEEIVFYLKKFEKKPLKSAYP